MSIYQRPLRSDELMHWGRKGFHKYIAKIGNRYFYTPEEVQAYKLAQVKGGVENAKHTAEANKLHQKSKDQLSQAQKTQDQMSKAMGEASRKNFRNALGSPIRFQAQKYEKEAKEANDRAKFLENRAQGLKRSSQANERIAQDHERQAQKALDDAKKQQENIVKDKSLLTQVAFKRAVEKEDREKKKKQQREAGKKKVQEWFRKKGWIY